MTILLDYIDYGECLVLLEKYEEAVSYLEESLEALRSMSGESDVAPSIAECK